MRSRTHFVSTPLVGVTKQRGTAVQRVKFGEEEKFFFTKLNNPALLNATKVFTQRSILISNLDKVK